MSHGASWYTDRVTREALRQAGGVSRSAIPEPTVAVLLRTCPKCHELTRITITEFADGGESWSCHNCNGVTCYRVR